MAGEDRPSAGRSRPLYESFGWAYDLVVPDPAGGGVDDVARRLRSLGVVAGSLVIDAGCGTGRYSRALAALGLRVIGVDRSEALIDQARARAADATFVCADLLSWRPPEPAAGVLCRGVLNDLTGDGERRAAFRAFGSWLRPGGILLADVRDWEATAARYAAQSRHERSVNWRGRTLQFVSDTELDSDRHLMHVRERYIGTVDGVGVDQSYDFVMRCWTPEEVRDHVAEAGLAALELCPGAEAGMAPDRLSLVARRMRSARSVSPRCSQTRS
jgi:SAM-dependent methyltransferase